ncbi:MAG: NADH-quinone oxidoreductase subunit L [Clostridia bacterium]|nr:NADH-quinone oxidoreductase subunit L [Clostridia bacterium]MDR3645025.1 NADH-quinone oxidoreductase subunit L [Clostridia bacterium]
MNSKVLLMFIVFFPIIGAFLMPIAGKISSRLRNILALIFVCVPFALSIVALPAAIGGQAFHFDITLPLGMSFGFLADGLAVFMAMTSSFLGVIIVVYSLGYIRHYDNQNEYYLCVVLFVGAMMGIVYSSNLVFIYVFWEISAICCWRLIGFYRDKDIVRRADKAFLITVGGALVMLIGFIMIYQQFGTFDLNLLKGKSLTDAVVILILFGIFSKSATLPLHSWLPDAGVAPSPVTALLHAAVLVKIGVYVFARLFLMNFTIGQVWHTAVPVIAAVSALIAAGAAIVETDMKRIIAYSTISQIGFIFLGLSVGSKLAVAGGLLYILMHGISKAGLFLCAGVIEQNAKTKDIRKLGGLAKTMPITAACFLLCAFSVMGIPPFGGFFSKYMVLNGAVEAGHPWIALVFLFGAILTMIYLLRLFAALFMGQAKTQNVKEGSASMLASITALAVLSIASGILIYYPSSFVNVIVQQMAVTFR